jgi:hypothetical protein
MPCVILKFPGGGTGWLCHKPESEPLKCSCGNDADYLCDGINLENADGVCSRTLCKRHRTIVEGKDLCPHCAAEHDAFPIPAIPAPPASSPRPRLVYSGPLRPRPEPPQVERPQAKRPPPPANQRLLPFTFDEPEPA